MSDFSVFIIFFCVFPFVAQAEDSLGVRPDVSMISSRDVITYTAKHRTAVRYRAIVVDPLGGSGGVSLILEKYFTDKEGQPDGVIYSKSFESSNLPLVSQAVKKLAKSSPKDILGCCKINNLIWQNGKMTFSVAVQKKLFLCKTTALESKNVKVTCQKN